MRTNLGRTAYLSRLLQLGVAVAALAGAGLAAEACSLVVQTSADQCTNDSDCTGDLAGRTCQGGVCVAGDAGGDGSVGGCQSSQECIDQLGALHVCRQPGGSAGVGKPKACVKLTNELCPNIYTTKKNDVDAYSDDNAFIFGSILPTVSEYDKSYGTLVEAAAALAIDDFAKVNGIPAMTGPGTRPLVLVACNDGDNEDRTDEAAEHLVEDLNVPAILGYAFSGNTIMVATDVTIPNGVLLFSPAATSNDITKLDEQHGSKDLVWRTSPPDSFQASALNLYYPVVEAREKAMFPQIGASEIKVAITHSGDSYGSGLADALQNKLTFNGKSATSQLGTNYARVDYGDDGSPNTTAVSTLKSFAPHIVFLFGYNGGIKTIFTQVEAGWGVPPMAPPSDGHKPMWVFSDGGEVSDLWDVAITTEDLRQRVSGSAPGTTTAYQPYANFRTEWMASAYSQGGTLSPDTLGPAGAYDIVFMFAYSAVAVGNQPLTGANMVKYGLRHMLPGQGVTAQATVGPQDISSTFTLLLGGVSFDIKGASGTLDFDQYGEAASDVQIWCVPKGTPVAGAGTNSGLYYDSATGKLAGAVGAHCDLP